MATKKVRVRPPEVRDAILRGDTEKLKELGRNGGLVTAAKRRRGIKNPPVKVQKKLLEELFIATRTEECRKRDEEANLHICPID